MGLASFTDRFCACLLLAWLVLLPSLFSLTESSAGGQSLVDSPANCAYVFTVWSSSGTSEQQENASSVCNPFVSSTHRTQLTEWERADAQRSGLVANCWFAGNAPCRSLSYALKAVNAALNDSNNSLTSSSVIVRLQPGVYTNADLGGRLTIPRRLSLVLMRANLTLSQATTTTSWATTQSPSGPAANSTFSGNSSTTNQTSNSTHPEEVMLTCEGHSGGLGTANSSTASVFNVVSLRPGARFALLGMTVERCHARFAMLMADEGHLRLENCTFRHNVGQIVAAFNSQLTIANTEFFHNSVSGTVTSVNSSVDIIAILDSLRWKAGVIFVHYNQSSETTRLSAGRNTSHHASITDSLFEGNGCFDYSLNTGQQLQNGFLDGAALGVLLEHEHAEVVVARTHFRGNRACGRGGGVYLDASGYAADNSLAIENCTFEDNDSNEDGAGLSVVVLATTVNTSVLVTGCMFRNNSAISGSGVDILFDNTWVGPGRASPLDRGSQLFRFHGCTWEGNHARVGSPSFRVRGHYARHKYGQRVIIDNCTFLRAHTAANPYATSFLAVQSNVEFYGDSLFAENNVTAVMFETANMYVGGHIVFRNNYGEQGGGLRIRMVSQVYMEEGSQLEFYDNRARIAGGGIYWEGPPAATRRAWFRFNPDCLFVYSTNRQEFPHNWKFNVTFEGNYGSRGGGAIYATSLSLCSWTNYNHDPVHDINAALQWPCMHFGENYASGDDIGGRVLNHISTVAYSIQTNDDGANQVNVPFLPPGEPYPLSVHALDDLGQRVVSTVFISSSNKDIVLPVDAFFTKLNYNSSRSSGGVSGDDGPSATQSLNSFQYQLRPNYKPPSVKFSFNLRDNSVFQATAEHTLLVNSTACPVGFSLQCNLTYPNRCECTCDTDNSDFIGFLYCSERQILGLRPGFFLALSKDEDEPFAIVPCPNNFCACRTQQGAELPTQAAARNISLQTVPYVVLPGQNHLEQKDFCLVNVILAQDTLYLCNAQRTGVLCGQCTGNLSHHKHSYNCRDCRATGTAVWRIPAVAVGSVIILLILVRLKFYVPSRFLGLIVFAQFSQYNRVTDASQNWVVRAGMYIDDLVSVRWWFGQCLLDRENAMDILAYGMLPAAIAAVTTLIVLALSVSFKVYSKLGIMPDRAIASLVHIWLVVYGGVMLHSCQLLHCVDVLGESVLFLDGSVKCFSGQHVLWGGLAIACIVLVGIVGPLLTLALALGKIRPQSQTTRWLCLDIREECAWWWICEFGFRLVMAACMAAWSHDSSMMQLLVPTVTFMTATALAQPYHFFLDNALTGFFLLDLAVVETLRAPRARSLLQDAAGYHALQAMAFLPYVGFFLVTAHFVYGRLRTAGDEVTWRMRVPDDDYVSEEEAYGQTLDPTGLDPLKRSRAVNMTESTRLRRIRRPTRSQGRRPTGGTSPANCYVGSLQEENLRSGLRDPLLAGEMWQLESGKPS